METPIFLYPQKIDAKFQMIFLLVLGSLLSSESWRPKLAANTPLAKTDEMQSIE
jgi:hypothetical protein